MKKLVLVMIALFTLSITNAQDFSLGVKAGVNYAGTLTTDSDYNDLFKAVIGPNFGVVAEYGLSDVFSIQGELMYSTSGSLGDGDGLEYGEFPFELNSNADAKLSYLSIPVLAKYYVTEAFSLEIGPYFSFLMSAKKDGSFSFVHPQLGEVAVVEYDDEDVKDDQYNSTDVGAAFGAGYELENGLFFNLRYNLGLADINAEEQAASDLFPAADSQDRGGADYQIKNNIFQFAVGYKFM